MATSQALKIAKKELRTVVKAKLSKVTQASIESQSKAVFQALLALKQYQDAKRICVYLSMPSGEIQTDEIVRNALSTGKDVFVPYLHKNVRVEGRAGDGDMGVTPKKVMDMVMLRGLGDYEALERDAWGIPTVTEESMERRERVLGPFGDGSEGGRRASLDLMLLPGVAFEVKGADRALFSSSGIVKRLGHGKGFYDYFLHRYRGNDNHGIENGAGSRLALIGLALEEQFLKDKHVPVGPYDSLLDGLIVGDGRIMVSAPS